jgi:hypothetical protein
VLGNCTRRMAGDGYGVCVDEVNLYFHVAVSCVVLERVLGHVPEPKFVPFLGQRSITLAYSSHLQFSHLVVKLYRRPFVHARRQLSHLTDQARV